MIKNCVNSYLVGCYSSCDKAIDLGFPSTFTGKFTLRLYMHGGVVDHTAFALKGSNLTVPNIFPDLGVYKFQIYNCGELVTFSDMTLKGIKVFSTCGECGQYDTLEIDMRVGFKAKPKELKLVDC